MQIWPAIDLRGGKCVRLRQGDFSDETEYADDPAGVAARWVACGADRLHLVDLDGARVGRSEHAGVVEAIIREHSVVCQLGGGIREESDIEGWLSRGVARLVIGTRALEDPAWFAAMAGRYPGRLVLGLDARGDLPAVSGWERTVEGSAAEWVARFAGLPLAGVVYTDIERDGMLAGPNFESTARMVEVAPWPVIASGGVTRLDDIMRLQEIGVAGCIVGRALYEGLLDLRVALDAVSAELARADRGHGGDRDRAADGPAGHRRSK